MKEPASATLALISEQVATEIAGSVPPGTPFTYECMGRMITVGVLRALIEIENRGGLALCLARIAAERVRAGCETQALGDAPPD